MVFYAIFAVLNMAHADIVPYPFLPGADFVRVQHPAKGQISFESCTWSGGDRDDVHENCQPIQSGRYQLVEIQAESKKQKNQVIYALVADSVIAGAAAVATYGTVEATWFASRGILNSLMRCATYPAATPGFLGMVLLNSSGLASLSTQQAIAATCGSSAVVYFGLAQWIDAFSLKKQSRQAQVLSAPVITDQLVVRDDIDRVIADLSAVLP